MFQVLAAHLAQAHLAPIHWGSLPRAFALLVSPPPVCRCGASPAGRCSFRDISRHEPKAFHERCAGSTRMRISRIWRTQGASQRAAGADQDGPCPAVVITSVCALPFWVAAIYLLNRRTEAGQPGPPLWSETARQPPASSARPRRGIAARRARRPPSGAAEAARPVPVRIADTMPSNRPCASNRGPPESQPGPRHPQDQAAAEGGEIDRGSVTLAGRLAQGVGPGRPAGHRPGRDRLLSQPRHRRAPGSPRRHQVGGHVEQGEIHPVADRAHRTSTRSCVPRGQRDHRIPRLPAVQHGRWSRRPL